MRDQRGQATVELVLLLPLVALLLAAVVQAGLLARDRVVVVHVARAAARAVAVRPDERSAVHAVAEAVGGDRRYSVGLAGRTGRGDTVVVTVTVRARRVPLVGLLVSGVVLRERLAVRVEGG